jgi:hypothetical protein
MSTPKIEWTTDIDIDWHLEDGVMIETHGIECHCGDCTQVSPGTDDARKEEAAK